MLTIKELAAAKSFAEEELRTFGLRESGGQVLIPYFNADGSEYKRVRIRSNVIAKDGSKWSPGDQPLIPYGLHFPVKPQAFVIIAEGETDCWALWTAGLPAIGVPGASNARCLRSEHLGPAEKVYVVQEPGEAGERFPHEVALRLYDGGYAGAVYAIKMPPPMKDPQQAFASDRDAFKDVMRTACRGAIPLPRPVAAAPAGNADVLSFDDLARRSSESVDWLIEGILRRSGILLMASRPKVGKSDTARNLAKAIATGTSFLGRRCQQGRVLWIGLEEPVQHLTDRLEVMNMRELDISFVVEQPAGDESAWLRGVVERLQPQVVIIDTIGRFSKIENVNDYSQVVRATQPMLDLRSRLGTTFVLLHHNNAANTTLGSTMWEGFCDSIMSLSRNADGTRFVQTKQRSGLEMEPTALYMDQDTGTIDCKESAFIADQRVAERRILAYLATVPGATREVLANQSGRKAYIGRAAVDSLLAANLVSATGSGTRGEKKIYSARVSPETREIVRDIYTPPILAEEPGLPEETSRTNPGEIPKNPGASRTIPKHPNNPEETEEPGALGSPADGGDERSAQRGDLAPFAENPARRAADEPFASPADSVVCL